MINGPGDILDGSTAISSFKQPNLCGGRKCGPEMGVPNTVLQER